MNTKLYELVHSVDDSNVAAFRQRQVHCECNRRVPGIGKKKAAEIYRVLNAECAAIDTEKNLEDALESQL